MGRLFRVPVIAAESLPTICQMQRCFKDAMPRQHYCVDHQEPKLEPAIHEYGFFVYFIQAGKGGPIKIGRSSSIKQRLADVQIYCPYEVFVLALIDCPWRETTIRLEQALHRDLKEFRMRGEWFKPSKEVRKMVHMAKTIELSYFCALLGVKGV